MKNLFFLLASILLFSCTTEKNTVVHRTFHNLHAKYNGFFNANEIIKSTYNTFDIKRTEDYTELLPIYPLPDKDESKNWYSPMDTAAAKCELVIFKHRMPHSKKGRSRNKEWCSWIDDNWMTIAQTKFYKQEYGKALKIFQYVESHYELENSYYQSLYWQAKTYIEMQAFEDAEEILLRLITKHQEQQKEIEEQPFLDEISTRVKPYIMTSKKKITLRNKWRIKTNYEERIKFLENQDFKVPTKLINQIYPTLADLYLKSGEDQKAITFLENALNGKHKKEFKTRLIFILAQLYAEEGNLKASRYYEWVVNRNPDYDMAFQAKINRALSFSGGDSKAIKAQLLKMLKDDKNIEYFDQIYFALAEIAFSDGLEDLAIEYLMTSVRVSVKNKKQKAKSLQKLGDWNYMKDEYLLAYQYYDTIQQVWGNDSVAKSKTLKRYKTLELIYQNSKTITDNDSILNICALSPEERSKKLYDVVDILEREKELAESKKLMASNNGLQMPSSNLPITQLMFFWDQNMLERGKSNFTSKWGTRKLEDNWRRANKKTSLSDDEFQDVGVEESNGIYEELLDGLPCDDTNKINKLREESLESMFSLGLTHHYETENLLKATYYFNIIVANHQPHESAIASIYELYLIHEELKNNTSKTEMESLLLKKYPNSKYAKLLSNDLNTDKSQYLKENSRYAKAYRFYMNGNYELAFDSAQSAMKDTLNPLYCSYSLLSAYSIAKIPNADDSSRTRLIELLKEVVSRCMGTSQGDQAYEILKNLKVINASSKDKWNFSFSPDTIHYFILFAPKESFDINKAKIAVADFNSASFSSYNLKTSNKFLNTSDQMIIVKSFPNSIEAMNYYDAFRVNKGKIKNYSDQNFFLLTPDNLKSLYLEKKIDEYLKFFKAFYL